MRLVRLFEALTISHIKIEKLKTAMTMLGLSLGIALFVAIRLANESAWLSFKDTVETVAPKNPLSVVGLAGGVPEQIIPEILKFPQVQAVSPLLVGYATAISGVLVEKMGWSNFFIFCILATIPGLLLLLRYKKWTFYDNN